jgi:hypothetical protein
MCVETSQGAEHSLEASEGHQTDANPVGTSANGTQHREVELAHNWQAHCCMQKAKGSTEEWTEILHSHLMLRTAGKTINVTVFF